MKMIFTTAACLFLLFAGGFAEPEPHHQNHGPSREVGAPFKLCVPEKAYKPCLKMIEQGKSLGIHLTCVKARDRMDCVEKIENHSADWGALEPEDMYVAAKHANKYYRVFKEIRTKEEPGNEFRYEAVAVVHKDLEINDLHQLQGLKSCHTGVGRNVGYKIPITKLTKMGILPPLNNTDMSPRENELSALSHFFSKACLVGKWAPDPETNSRLKTQYSNLCALCEFPEKCDYPDANSGYEGALRCLTKGGGEVAWTKVIYVKKVFGMPYGTKPAAEVDVNPNDYAYLCNDATKKPLTGPPCTWAARPWPGYVANEEIIKVTSELKELRDEIKTLNDFGESEHADWLTSVLALNNETLAVDSNTVITPQEYLDKAKYTDVIERDVLKPTRKVKLCVTSDIEKEKCLTLKKAAFSRDIRPEIECRLEPSQEKCMNAVSKKEADIVSIDIGYLNKAESKKLEPVASEIYDNNKTSQYVVALIKKTSSFNSLNDFKGAKACLSNGYAAGVIAPISALLKKNVIQVNSCPRTKALAEFFTGGVKQSNNPIQCLVSGEGDVAFVGSEELKLAFEPSEDIKSAEYEIIRLDGGRCDVNKANECHIAEVPARVIVAPKDLSRVELDDILFAILSSGKMFNKYKNEHVFKMFGDYNNQSDVLFSNYAVGFVNNHEASSLQQEFKKILSEVDSCSA